MAPQAEYNPTNLMTLESGQSLGGYNIVSSLGVGGMGEVYLAHDSKLDRQVAIKVLPADVAADPERLARFQREARALAALNHPNVATLFGFDTAAVDDRGSAISFIAMELVEGDTLQERIARGPVPIDEALRLFLAIAAGLEAAHAKGIVHRDLKPANIKVGGSGSSTTRNKTGEVKILDFGLAKAMALDDPAGSPELSHSPTLTLAATQRGEILGTAAYMSPEQAQGEPADARSDIWAFGVCLMETLRGRRIFEGANHSFVLASVLKDEPDFDSLPPATPRAIRRVLKRCLEKDPERRFHDIADVRLEIEEALQNPEEVSEPQEIAVARPLGLWTWVGLAAGIALGTLGMVVISSFQSTPADQPIERYVLNAPPNPRAGRSPGNGLTITRDGRKIIYLTGSFPNTSLWVRNLDQTEATLLISADAPFQPFLSPDEQWVGFFGNKGLAKVSILGGPPVSLFTRDVGFPAQASWGDDDRIVFATDVGPLRQIGSSGGEVTELTQLEDGEGAHRTPVVLPGSRAVLFTARRGSGESTIEAIDLGSGERKSLIVGAQPRFAESGHLIFEVDDTLRAVAFDPDKLELIGDPVPVIHDVVTTSGGHAKYALAGDAHALAYVAGSEQDRAYRLTWVDRQGNEEPIGAPLRLYVYPRVSPDGTRLALDVRADEEDIWIWDIQRESLTRLTFGPGTDAAPEWSADGKSVFYGTAQENSNWDVFMKPADGTGQERRFTESPKFNAPDSVTPDGRWLLVLRSEGASPPFDVLLVDITGEEETRTLLEADFDIQNTHISPDGRWLAYQSDESGGSEIFVRPFPNLDHGRWQVSNEGGTRPRWSPKGGEIFYLDAQDRLTTARAEVTGEAISFRKPELLLEKSYQSPKIGRSYDVSPDGQRFVMIDTETEEVEEDGGQIILVKNWFDELKRVAKVKN